MHLAEPTVAPDTDPDAEREQDDTRLAWQGLLILARRQFKADDDVAVLLQVLERQPAIQDAIGATWPITQLVQALEANQRTGPWTVDRVDNAKRRLRAWIDRMRREQNLDRTDFMAVLVHCARRHGQSESPERRRAPALG